MFRATFALLVSLGLLNAASPFDSEIALWRQQREEALKAPDGWLTVSGLFWLKEGENRAGSDPASEILMPQGRAPKRVGFFDLDKGRVTFRIAHEAHVLLNNKTVREAQLKPDVDKLQMGDFTLFVIQRSGKYAIRMRDLHSKMRDEFKVLHWYPANPAYRVTAKFTSYEKAHTVAIPNILGMTEMMQSPGYATFDLQGHSYRLDPVLEDNQLFFIFKDLTAGKTTYGAGRFLHADLPKEGKVTIDFNKAYNPPCAFTEFATCPLPPKQNRLPIKIEAGELKYGDH